jgi:hypothetical protein
MRAPRRPAAVTPQRGPGQADLVGPLLALTVTTGFVDGVSYLGLGALVGALLVMQSLALPIAVAAADVLAVTVAVRRLRADPAAT